MGLEDLAAEVLAEGARRADGKLEEHMMTAEQLAKDLERILNENLISVVLYGSTAMEDTTKNFSDINILIVVKNADLATLQSLAPVVKGWCKQGNPAPLILPSDTIEKAKDVFAIEFSDIQSAHKVLAGQEVFASLKIDSMALRLQLEFELRSKLFLLRKNFLESVGENKALQQLMARAYPGLSVLAKTILRLLNQPVPLQKKTAWADLSTILKIDTGVVDLVTQLREGDKTILRTDPEIIFGHYLELIERIIEFVDKFEVKK